MISLIKNALKNMARRRISTALTLLGIAVGVMSVVLIGALSDYGERAVAKELDSLGFNGLSVSAAVKSVELSIDDCAEIKKLSGVADTAPYCSGAGKISQGGKIVDTTLWGVQSGSNRIFSSDIIFGRDITLADCNDEKAVCLLDKSIAKALFGRENVCSKTVGVSYGGYTVYCEVAGITSADSTVIQSMSGEVMPEFVYLPYTLMTRLCGSEKLSSITVKLGDGAEPQTVSADITAMLDNDRGTSGAFKCDNLSAQRERLESILSIVKKLLSSISVVALIVSGFGIMTVMLVSVNERTREIGIKKAIGAGFMTILNEFLTEALTISLLGSIIGAVSGAALGIAAAYAFGADIRFNAVNIASAVLSAGLCGAVFGVYPAIKAAKMPPVKALRHE